MKKFKLGLFFGLIAIIFCGCQTTQNSITIDVLLSSPIPADSTSLPTNIGRIYYPFQSINTDTIYSVKGNVIRIDTKPLLKITILQNDDWISNLQKRFSGQTFQMKEMQAKRALTTIDISDLKKSTNSSKDSLGTVVNNLYASQKYNTLIVCSAENCDDTTWNGKKIIKNINDLIRSIHDSVRIKHYSNFAIIYNPPHKLTVDTRAKNILTIDKPINQTPIISHKKPESTKKEQKNTSNSTILSSLIISPSNDNKTLIWNDLGEKIRYKITLFDSDDADNPVKLKTFKSQDGRSFSPEDLTENHSYSILVEAINNSGNGSIIKKSCYFFHIKSKSNGIISSGYCKTLNKENENKCE